MLTVDPFDEPGHPTRVLFLLDSGNVLDASQAIDRCWPVLIVAAGVLTLLERPAPEGASITATAASGGIDILVPKGWRLSGWSTPIFGGLDDKTDHSQAPAADAPTLHIDAVSVFGGVDIKHEK